MSYSRWYERQRSQIKCKNCGTKAYRRKLCRPCYKEDRRTNGFHCTVGSCICPCFSHTLCQRHYQAYMSRCLICNEKNTYCRHLCRTHYREACKTGDFPVPPTCSQCDTVTFVNDLCLHHFKESVKTSCLVIGCEKDPFRRGLCTTHFFRAYRKHKKAMLESYKLQQQA